MLNFKNFILIFYFSLVFAPRARKQDLEPYSRFKSIKCLSSNSSVSNFKCIIKAYSQINTTTSIFVTLSKPVFLVYVRFDFRHRSLSNSQRSIINVTFEICSILNGTQTNPVYKWIIGLLPGMEKYLHPCPFKVLLNEFWRRGFGLFKESIIDLEGFL